MSNQVNRKACRTPRVRYQRSTMHGCGVTAWWPDCPPIVKQALPIGPCLVMTARCEVRPAVTSHVTLMPMMETRTRSLLRRLNSTSPLCP